MKLSKLLSGLEYELSNLVEDAEITAVCSDSRRAGVGSLFVCITGSRQDGHSFAHLAFEKGAAAVVTEYSIEGLPCVVCRDTRFADAIIWANYYDNPQNKLNISFVTGTNGKTSTAEFMYNVLAEAGVKCGIIGTLGARTTDGPIEFCDCEMEDMPSAMTTPDPEGLYGVLRQMVRLDVRHVVMEASSHAIAQKKLAAIEFDVGIFTNLSHEHLDYHKTIENYFLTKASLFTQSKKRVICTDSIWGKRLAEMYPASAEVSRKNARNTALTAQGVEYDFLDMHIKSEVAAEFTVENTMLAAAAALEMGVDRSAIEKGICDVKNICGRMEHVIFSDEYGFDAYIDYAHTPSAMRDAIESARRISRGTPITVLFGCGGNRDREKRSLMGRCAEMLADKIIVCADNSRNEETDTIINDILSGMKCPEYAFVIEDREVAIEFAVRQACEGEVLLLLGKGHECYEIDQSGKHPFDERKILLRSAERKVND